MVSRQDADLALLHFGNKLFRKNPNLSKISVVAITDENDNPTDEYILEAGVISMKIQEAATRLGNALTDELVPFELPLADEQGNALESRIPVRIVQTGRITLLGCQQVGGNIQSFTDRVRPVNGGNSVSSANDGYTGTFGSAVKLKDNSEEKFFLSNWHILVGKDGEEGDKIIQPGRGDGGSTVNDIIGKVHSFRIDHHLDAAVGKADEATLIKAGFRCFKKYSTTAVEPKLNSKVIKCGRSTETTHGVITSINATISAYPIEEPFTNQIETTKMCEDGDSGSITFHDESMEPVGLLFAGDDSATYHNKLVLVFHELGIERLL